MPEGCEEVLPCEEELAAGFSAQTLGYPDTYELPKLGNDRKLRLERAVALEIDLRNRIKRCRTSDGYIHEVLVEDEWQEYHRFGSLAEVLDSEIFAVFQRKNADNNTTAVEHD